VKALVTAALSWYDEPPDLLEACIRGAAEIADRIVAVDGAYRRYPDAKVTSPFRQVKVIRDTAARLGIECDVYVPNRLWAGQVEKRSFLVQRAAEDSEWLALIDADHIIHADREAARAELKRLVVRSHVNIVSVPFYTPLHPKRSVEKSSASHWHAKLADKRFYHCHFLRALPGLRVERFHYWYSGLKNGQRVWLPFGGKPSKKREAAAYPVMLPRPMRARYEVEHVTLLRDEKHILAGRAFCNDRVMIVQRTGQEDDVPGLPPPVFDYETVPY
jgi:hypothetical protein